MSVRGDHAGEHNAQQAVDEDNNTDDKGQKHGHPLAFDQLALLGQIVDKALNAAGDTHQNDKGAHQSGKHKGLQVSGVGTHADDDVDALVNGDKRIPAADNHLAGKNTDQHGEGDLSCHNGNCEG